jgi:hypothetical protein
LSCQGKLFITYVETAAMSNQKEEAVADCIAGVKVAQLTTELQ